MVLLSILVCNTWYFCLNQYAIHGTSVYISMHYKVLLSILVCSTWYFCLYQYAVHGTFVYISMQYMVLLSILVCNTRYFCLFYNSIHGTYTSALSGSFAITCNQDKKNTELVCVQTVLKRRNIQCFSVVLVLRSHPPFNSFGSGYFNKSNKWHTTNISVLIH